MNTVFVLVASGGAYSDSWEEVLGVHETSQGAKDHAVAEFNKEESGRWYRYEGKMGRWKFFDQKLAGLRSWSCAIDIADMYPSACDNFNILEYEVLE